MPIWSYRFLKNAVKLQLKECGYVFKFRNPDKKFA